MVQGPGSKAENRYWSGGRGGLFNLSLGNKTWLCKKCYFIKVNVKFQLLVKTRALKNKPHTKHGGRIWKKIIWYQIVEGSRKISVGEVAITLLNTHVLLPKVVLKTWEIHSMHIMSHLAKFMVRDLSIVCFTREKKIGKWILIPKMVW